MLVLWLTDDQKIFCYGSANQANSAFHSSRLGKWVIIHVITYITEWRPSNGKPGLYGCLVALVGLLLIGCAPTLSVTQKCHCSCSMRLVALYKCYMPLPTAPHHILRVFCSRLKTRLFNRSVLNFLLCLWRDLWNYGKLLLLLITYLLTYRPTYPPLAANSNVVVCRCFEWSEHCSDICWLARVQACSDGRGR